MSQTPGTEPLFGAALDRRGNIVLVPLIALTLLILVLVLGGKLLYPPPPRYVDSRAPAEVVSPGRVAFRLQPGDSAWVVALDNGAAAVFRDPSGGEVLGVVTGALLMEWPAPAQRPSPGVPRR